jgi:carbonic anhydrase
MAIDDPYKAVALDIAALLENPVLPQGVTLSGLVYDVANGQIRTVVAPAIVPPT